MQVCHKPTEGVVKIIVIGGTGLIGSKIVTRLLADGWEAVAASRSSGVDTTTGRGLADVLAGASVVIDVSTVLCSVSVGAPLNGTIEIAGPEQFRAHELARRRLMARHDSRKVVPDPRARFFGAEVDERSLLPGSDARLAQTRFEAWLAR